MYPTGYQRMSTPKASTSPAMPRKLAADRYSPHTAKALERGLTTRLAT